MRWWISRIAVLALTWWILTKGASDAWQVGIPALLAALYVDYRLFRPRVHRWSMVGLVRYALFFLKLSATSGIDVAWRAYHPHLPLNPGMKEYPLKLTLLSARNLFVCTVSLLPGTLSVELGEDRIAESGGQTEDFQLDDAADGIVVVLGGDDGGFKPSRIGWQPYFGTRCQSPIIFRGAIRSDKEG